MRKTVFGFPTRYYTNLAVQGLQPQKMTRGLKFYLCMLARKLLVMPASSAAIERIFSNFGLIQTKLRNKLGSWNTEMWKVSFLLSDVKWKR